MEVIRLRAATVSDVPKLMAMCAAERNAPQWAQSTYEELIFASEQDKALVRVAYREAEEVVGFYAARRLLENEWELENIVVDSETRRGGVGVALMNDMILRVGTERTVQIFLEVRASNVAARRLYEKFGWRETGRRRGYYADPVEDAVLYQRAVGL